MSGRLRVYPQGTASSPSANDGLHKQAAWLQGSRE